MKFVIRGNPVSKENNKKIAWIAGAPRVYYAASYREWAASALKQLVAQYENTYEVPVRLSMDVYKRKRSLLDFTNMFKGVCDVLQSANIVKNDRLITGVGVGDMYVDDKDPRVELTLEIK